MNAVRSHFDVELVMDEFARSLRDELDAGLLDDGGVGVLSAPVLPSGVGPWVRKNS